MAKREPLELYAVKVKGKYTVITGCLMSACLAAGEQKGETVRIQITELPKPKRKKAGRG